jgi:putative inorganic carbon (hco3(-)) transporter
MTTLPTIAEQMTKPVTVAKQKDSFAFRALLFFSFVYYARPEDVIHPLQYIPIARIAGGLAFLALILGLFSRHGKMRFPLELKLLFLLFMQMCLSVPFAYWRGGSFGVVFSQFSRAVIVAVLVGMLVEALPQLRKLLFVQAAALSFMAVSSILVHNVRDGRLYGAMGGIFENPNDLAANIALNLPLCLAFLLYTREAISKVFWSCSMVAMLYVVYATYSRSGFLALAMGGLLCLWEFGIKGRRIPLVALASILLVVFVVVAPSRYYTRLASTVIGNVEGSMDEGSREARKELLTKSLEMMAAHPLLGVGPGNFEVLSGSWNVAHNTYTQVGAEAGVPALILFLLILWATYRNLRAVQKSPLYTLDKGLRIFTGGLVASLGAYLVAAFFASTPYHLFPYFLVAYTTGLYRIAYPEAGKNSRSGANRNGQENKPNNRKRELAWTV